MNHFSQILPEGGRRRCPRAQRVRSPLRRRHLSQNTHPVPSLSSPTLNPHPHNPLSDVDAKDAAWALLDSIREDLRVVGDRLTESILAFFNKQGACLSLSRFPFALLSRTRRPAASLV